MPKRYEMGSMQEKIARRDLMEQGFEYDGVRKYQEGDRISRVHWNLYAATGGLWVRKNEEEEEERVKIGLSLDDIEKDRISDYMAAFYSISFFLKSQGVIQEIYYGEHKYLLCHIEQYEELFTDIFVENMNCHRIRWSIFIRFHFVKKDKICRNFYMIWSYNVWI